MNDRFNLNAKIQILLTHFICTTHAEDNWDSFHRPKHYSDAITRSLTEALTCVYVVSLLTGFNVFPGVLNSTRQDIRFGEPLPWPSHDNLWHSVLVILSTSILWLIYWTVNCFVVFYRLVLWIETNRVAYCPLTAIKRTLCGQKNIAAAIGIADQRQGLFAWQR